jgi:hypothetical protein
MISLETICFFTLKTNWGLIIILILLNSILYSLFVVSYNFDILQQCRKGSLIESS